jgi:adenine-specific DNA-methyltransferase
MKEHLRAMPEPGTVPLLYPCHFAGQSIQWPRADTKKPNAIKFNAESKKWLYPNGCYVVVRRFSSKEERRRVVATVVCSDDFDAPALGFENHLNVFHSGKQGIPEDLGRGLAVFLNSTAFDESFRRFSGHTQVNATDLRRMKYPSRETLLELGKWARQQATLSQETIDNRLERLA